MNMKYNVKESEYEKLLGITVDKKLSFRKHIEEFCKKTNKKTPSTCSLVYLIIVHLYGCSMVGC